MVVTIATAIGTASAVRTLSEATWKLGIALSKLDQDTRTVDTTVKNLAEEVKSLGNECDLLYAELEEVISKAEAGSPLPHDVDGRLWDCLATQVEVTRRTMQDIELFVKNVAGEQSLFIRQVQRQKKMDESRDQIASMRTKVCRHTNNLRTTLLVVITVLTHIAPSRADRGLAKELDRLRDMVEKLQRSSKANPQSTPSHTDTTLMQCAREVIAKGTAMYEENLAAESIDGGRGAPTSNVRVSEWVNALEFMRRDERLSDPSDLVSNRSSIFSGNGTYTFLTSANSEQPAVPQNDAVGAVEDDSDSDLDTDLAKAALETGTKAFEAQEWEEADSLLQEALRVLQQLPKQQRAFCDIFALQYKLAVCAYHTQEPADAEEALMSMVQQTPTSDEQRRYICDASHLLSLSYIRIDQVDRARSECEKALQARRRLLGKRSDTSLESMALMAHIYVLLNNRARAKLCLAMIPEERRDAILRVVEESLGMKVEHLEAPSPLARSMSEDSELALRGIQNSLSAPSLSQPMGNRCYGPVSSTISQSPATSLRQLQQHNLANKAGLEDVQSVTVTSLSSAEERSESRGTGKDRPSEDHFAGLEALGAVDLSLNEPLQTNKTLKGKSLSRKVILDKVGCQPRDDIEEAVCKGDHAAFASLLNKKKGWRSKLRKRLRPERVTALHFAALFGEIDMARGLLVSDFNINEVPYGYSTSLTPLKFAIGARQVETVEFLIANGAKPSEPDSWSILAGQLMNRSWLMKTMSEAEKEHVPDRIVAILRVLLKHGWDVNAPFETSGGTVLHQAVTFWTGSYRWDLNLRAVVTSFLCEHGANPHQANMERKTPYSLALASGHQDLLLILERGSKEKANGWPVGAVELPGEFSV